MQWGLKSGEVQTPGPGGNRRQWCVAVYLVVRSQPDGMLTNS